MKNGERKTERWALLFAVAVLFSCVGKQDPFIGRWTVEKVNVEFDEFKSTPEMVRQYGEMEKGNIIEISEDSVLMFVSNGDTLRGKCSINGDQLNCDGVLFGRFENGVIETKMATPLGAITIKYRKE